MAWFCVPRRIILPIHGKAWECRGTLFKCAIQIPIYDILERFSVLPSCNISPIVYAVYMGMFLTFASVGGGYCSHSVCLSVPKIPAKLWILTLRKYYQQTSNHTRIKNNNRLLLKPFCFIILTTFVTHGRRFTTFRRRLVAKKIIETQLILLEGYRCWITAWNQVQFR